MDPVATWSVFTKVPRHVIVTVAWLLLHVVMGMIMLARLGHSPREMTGVLWARVRSPPPKVRERLRGGDRGSPSPREARGIVGLAHSIERQACAYNIHRDRSMQ